jgi:hypothetical protein
MHNLVVLKDMEDKILGINFIRQHMLSYNFLSDKCFWETQPIDSGYLKAAKRVHIEALSEKN